MSLASDLTQMDNTLTALLEYANGVTGASDVSVGDAIHTLGEGYGGGSSVLTGTITGAGSKTVTIPTGSRVSNIAIVKENPSTYYGTSSWQTAAAFSFLGLVMSVIYYSTSSQNRGTATVTFNDTNVKVTAQYDFPSGQVFNWVAW